jgi:putative protease
MRIEGEYIPSKDQFDMFAHDEHKPAKITPPSISVSLSGLEQFSKELEELCPRIIYIPITEFDYESPKLHEIIKSENTTIAVALPGIIHDSERKRIAGMLSKAAKLGISNALVSNIGHMQFAKRHGMTVRGDFALNVFNSETLYVLQKLGLKSATISFELSLSEIREISKPIDTELITYGRLPLMLTENCIVRNSTDACTCDSFTGLVDEHGAVYPVLPEFGCRNVLLHSKKLFMADKRRTISSLGIWAERLNFTTENAIECVTVTKRFMGLSDYKPPGFTRGMYYRIKD